MIRIFERENGIGGLKKYTTCCTKCKLNIIFSNTLLPPFACGYCATTLPSYSRLVNNLMHRLRFHEQIAIGSKYT